MVFISDPEWQIQKFLSTAMVNLIPILENTSTIQSPKRRQDVFLLKTTTWSVLFYWKLKVI